MRGKMNYIYALYGNYNIDAVKAFMEELVKNKYLDEQDKFNLVFKSFSIKSSCSYNRTFCFKKYIGIILR